MSAARMITERHGLDLDIATMSEQGPRPENQDAALTEGFEKHGILAVADGMGGERSGRVAADVALAALAEGGPIRTFDDARRAVRHADAAVVAAAEQDPANRGGMGCALGMISLTASNAEIPYWIGAHVGDVRIMSRSPDGVMRLETRDHTPAFARWEAGEITLDQVPDSKGANRLHRAVGRGGEPDAVRIPAHPGWSYLIVSDGVYKEMRLDELGEAMAAASATEVCERIRTKVSERGPDDNFTALVVQILDGAAASTLHLSNQEATVPDPRPTPASPTPARNRSSVWTPLAVLLALIAAGAAAYAIWTMAELQERNEIQRLQVDSLGAQIDSLDARLFELDQIFGIPADPLADTLNAPQTEPTIP